MKNKEDKKPEGVVRTTRMEECPHCGTKLSPWEQVLLSVDRVLMCKNCWYRIILDVFGEDETSDDQLKEK
ncbi:MAG: hypothetical protein AB7T22_12310 [Calditrichaceae bacterium]